MVELTSQSEQYFQTQWQSIAKEPVEVHAEGSTLYALGSELAALRLAYRYKNGKVITLADGNAVFRLEM